MEANNIVSLLSKCACAINPISTSVVSDIEKVFSDAGIMVVASNLFSLEVRRHAFQLMGTNFETASNNLVFIDPNNSSNPKCVFTFLVKVIIKLKDNALLRDSFSQMYVRYKNDAASMGCWVVVMDDIAFNYSVAIESFDTPAGLFIVTGMSSYQSAKKYINKTKDLILNRPSSVVFTNSETATKWTIDHYRHPINGVLITRTSAVSPPTYSPARTPLGKPVSEDVAVPAASVGRWAYHPTIDATAMDRHVTQGLAIGMFKSTLPLILADMYSRNEGTSQHTFQIDVSGSILAITPDTPYGLTVLQFPATYESSVSVKGNFFRFPTNQAHDNKFTHSEQVKILTLLANALISNEMFNRPAMTNINLKLLGFTLPSCCFELINGMTGNAIDFRVLE